MGLISGYQDCRKIPAWTVVAGEGGKVEKQGTHPGLDKICWVILQFWKEGERENKFCCLLWCEYTNTKFFYHYIRDDFIILQQIAWKKKIENYIIAKETDFWLPKQACMIVLLISCPASHSLSSPTVISFFFCLFVCMRVIFWVWSSPCWPILDTIHDCQLCALGFEMVKLVWSLCCPPMAHHKIPNTQQKFLSL